jgi:hypothetical protein
MDPNDSNQVTDQPQSDAAQTDANQQQSVPADPVQQDNPSAESADATQQTDSAPSDEPATDQTQPDDQQAAGTSDVQAGSYIDDVGGDMIGLLDEIEEDENLIQMVADEMALDKEKVKTILTGLLDKIDKEQITVEEIALIMAATVADELPEEGTTETPQAVEPSETPATQE